MSIKVQKLVSDVSPFSGISFVNKMFDSSGLSNLIDNELGIRGKLVGYSYSDNIKNLACVFLSGGSYIEDINTNLGEHLSSIPGNNVPSADTVLRALTQLANLNPKAKNSRKNLICNAL